MFDDVFKKVDLCALRRIRKNDYYAGLLQNLFCGSEGSVICALQSDYFSFILSPFDEGQASAFCFISDCEREISRIIARLIVYVGGSPAYISAQGRWLGGRQIDYVKNVREMFDILNEQLDKQIIDLKTCIAKMDYKEVTCVLKELVNVKKTEKQKLINILKK